MAAGAYDLAELDVTGYWRQVGRSLGRSYGEAEVAELARLDCASWLRLQAGTVALIEDLAAAGRPLALLSNAPDQLADAIRALPIAAHFGQLIFSCQLKLAKPDPRCYSDALARLGASPDEVIFIDDRTENVAAAAALGLRIGAFHQPRRDARGRDRAAGQPRLNPAWRPGRRRPATRPGGFPPAERLARALRGCAC